ncbi:unnamed protein product [Penicillium roqueforti FM164]|uniref:Genomic scaffold, ProqFM164S01 n=1 Tax=Penicillium roqueforti (strain FM164) TaxID=1365484 RepID=W6PTK7_PENRF|nr:unnamed protein product [Penicillium roqueforti FM164]
MTQIANQSRSLTLYSDTWTLLPPDTSNLLKPRGRLLNTIHQVLTRLQGWSQSVNLGKMGNRPMTMGFWCLLLRVFIDWLVDIVSTAIPKSVLKVFKDEMITLESLLALPAPSQSIDEHGIYLSVITETYQHGNTVSIYVGSSVAIRVRIIRHKSPSLWETHPNSPLYRLLWQGVKAQFRLLASLKSPIERGYLKLFEGVFIVLLGGLQKPQYETEWVKDSAWGLYN